jgi:hypothetical protein
LEGVRDIEANDRLQPCYRRGEGSLSFAPASPARCSARSLEELKLDLNNRLARPGVDPVDLPIFCGFQSIVECQLEAVAGPAAPGRRCQPAELYASFDDADD